MKALHMALIGGGIALAAVGITLGLTNPNKEDYQDYAIDELVTYMKEEGCQDLPETLGDQENLPSLPRGIEDLITSKCPELIEEISPAVEEIIGRTTKRRNFLFFSLYYTDLSGIKYLPVDKFTTLGILQNFYIYQAEKI